MVGEAATSGEAHNIMAKNEDAYEIDWNSGTTWMGEWKLGSSTHRQPKKDTVKILPAGWIDLEAVARATGVAFDMALAAFEREL